MPRLLPLALTVWVLASGERAEGTCGVWEYTPQYTPVRCNACPGEECPTVECLEHGGLQRCWRKFVPNRLSSPVRVVFDMHGHSQNMDHIETMSGWRRVAEAEGLVVVWPQGTDFSWNAGGVCCPPANIKQIDDVGFLRRVAENVSATHGVELNRHVYWGGYSNGCAMAQRMAREANDIVAAVGCHAMYLTWTEEQAQQHSTAAQYADKPVPVITVHGTLDLVVGYRDWYGFNATDNLERWARLNECPTPTAWRRVKITPALKFRQDSDRRVLVSSHTGCKDGTEAALVTLPGVGHAPFLALETPLFDTTQVRWRPS
jgi:polyhydroxybutyrate depolymerase